MKNPKSEIKPISQQEIEILAEKFEIGDRVHYGHFLQFFREISTPLNYSTKGGSGQGSVKGSVKGRGRSYTAVDGSVQFQNKNRKKTI